MFESIITKATRKAIVGLRMRLNKRENGKPYYEFAMAKNLVVEAQLADRVDVLWDAERELGLIKNKANGARLSRASSVAYKIRTPGFDIAQATPGTQDLDYRIEGPGIYFWFKNTK